MPSIKSGLWCLLDLIDDVGLDATAQLGYWWRSLSSAMAPRSGLIKGVL
jgi:hypothetical protein